MSEIKRLTAPVAPGGTIGVLVGSPGTELEFAL